MPNEEIRKQAAKLYSRFKEFADDPTVPKTIRRNIAALKAIAQEGEKREKGQ